MLPLMARRLVIQLVTDPADSERLTVALSVAAAASAAGTPVSLWLAGECAWLAVAGERDRFGQEALDLFDGTLELSRVSVCSRCADRRGIGAERLLPGATIRGAAEFAEEASSEAAQVLVY